MSLSNWLFGTSAEAPADSKAESSKTPVTTPSNLELPDSPVESITLTDGDDYDKCDDVSESAAETIKEKSPVVAETKEKLPTLTASTPPTTPLKPVETSQVAPVAEAIPSATHRPPPPIENLASAAADQDKRMEPVSISLSPSSTTKSEKPENEDKTGEIVTPTSETKSSPKQFQLQPRRTLYPLDLSDPPHQSPIREFTATKKSSWQSFIESFVENCCPCFQDLFDRMRYRNRDKVHRI